MPPPFRRSFDIVMVSDFRFPGGTSASMANEIRAQARAGYTTGLVQVPAPLLKTPRPFNPKIRRCLDDGLAYLVLTGEPVDARLLVIRHPAVFAVAPAVVPDVHAQHKLMVVNQAPRDASQPEPFYDVVSVARVIDRVFGNGFAWTPIGPLVRESLRTDSAHIDLLEHDWHNILDVDEWVVGRVAPRAGQAVIGRHSRPHWRKWPATREEILAAYPDDATVTVRILGGAEVPRRVLGRLPANWEALPFDSVDVREFLASIDFFVYYHHAGLVEAFGRAIIEAVATGAVAILPPHFAVVFGDACAYAELGDVRAVIERFVRDPAAYEAQSSTGRALVEARFGFASHVARVAELIGPPVGGNAAAPADSAGGVPLPRTLLLDLGVSETPSALPVMATRLRPDLRCAAVTTRAGDLTALAELGAAYDLLPSPPSTGEGRAAWHADVAERVDRILCEIEPATVVVLHADAGARAALRQGGRARWLQPASTEDSLAAHPGLVHALQGDGADGGGPLIPLTAPTTPMTTSLASRTRRLLNGGRDLTKRIKRAVPPEVKERVRPLLADARVHDVRRRARAAYRALAASGTEHLGVAALQPGAPLAGLVARRWPVVAVVAPDIDAAGFADLVRRTALVQTMQLSFAPVFIVGTPSVGPALALGYTVELLPHRGVLARLGAPMPWSQVLEGRLGDVHHRYGAPPTVVVAGVTPARDFEGALRAAAAIAAAHDRPEPASAR